MEWLAVRTAEMERKGVRRLFVISGTPDWGRKQAEIWIARLAGDWLWVGPEKMAHQPVCDPTAMQTLLGREFHHAVFDARTGFHADAFAALSGVLVAGSWLLLLVPPWSEWGEHPDSDTLRWSACQQPLATPVFVRYFQLTILNAPLTGLHCQGKQAVCCPLSSRPDWHADEENQQQSILQTLLCSKPGVSVVTAPRGRGKSALAGMLAQRWSGDACWVTAPAKGSTEVLARFAGAAFHFIAPDALLAMPRRPEQVDWLLIDEAAAIPMPQLQQMIALFPRVLLTTTVQGYEGTGRGFLLKFCAALPNAHFYHLAAPLRWADNDPLEKLTEQALILAEPALNVVRGRLVIRRLQSADGHIELARLIRIYQLLMSAHYRTSPLDLRRMLDAPGMHFMVAENAQSELGGALWLVEEGLLDADLTNAIWAGYRRPRGNLVAQSLAAHAGFPCAAQLSSLRISRIAIVPDRRREGLGLSMIRQIAGSAQGVDYLSVSFGFTAELWRFWQACGFHLVRIGTQREASSGCYTVMALLPLSPSGCHLVQQAKRRLSRDLFWLQGRLDEVFPVDISAQQALNDDDWAELAGFAFASRPFAVSFPALARLLATCSDALPALRGALTEGQSVSEQVCSLKLSGRKALLSRWRQEARQALFMLSSERAQCWQQQIREMRQYKA